MTRALLIAVLLTSTAASATDRFMHVWEDRVNQSENPDAKAMDMCSDWCWDHRKKLAAMDAVTLQQGFEIKQWMDDHSVPLPSRARAVFEKLCSAPAPPQEKHVSKVPQPLTENPLTHATGACQSNPTPSSGSGTSVSPDGGYDTFQGTLLPPPVRGADQP